MNDQERAEFDVMKANLARLKSDLDMLRLFWALTWGLTCGSFGVLYSPAFAAFLVSILGG